MGTSAADSTLAPWPFYDDDEIAAVAAILKSGRVNYWTGDEGRAFERDYAAATGTAHALAVANGTLALELALFGLGIGPGDDVIVPARTFVATASAVVARGARPVVVDVDLQSQNLSAETVAPALTARTKAIIPVHLAGWPVDMEPLMALAKTRDVAVIEDCAQAHGAVDRGRPVGGIGRIGCFSFCQDKIISTGGEGGMVVTSDRALYERMWSFRDHGKDYARAQTADSSPGFKFLVDSFGTNWRLTEIQAKIGRLQLQKLPRWVESRRAHAAALTAALAKFNAVTVPRPPAHSRHAFYKYTFCIDPTAMKSGWTRDRICAELNGKGVPARVGACPDISREAAFAKAGIGAQPDHPSAAVLTDRTIMLPVHPTLTPGNIAFIAEVTAATIAAATR